MEYNQKSEPPLSEEAVNHLKLTLNTNIARNMQDEIWKKCFEYYNERNTIKIKMSCRPCYTKALIFYITHSK